MVSLQPIYRGTDLSQVHRWVSVISQHRLNVESTAQNLPGVTLEDTYSGLGCAFPAHDPSVRPTVCGLTDVEPAIVAFHTMWCWDTELTSQLEKCIFRAELLQLESQ